MDFRKIVDCFRNYLLYISLQALYVFINMQQWDWQNIDSYYGKVQ